MRKLLYFTLSLAIACSPATMEEEMVHGIDPANMDQTADPKTDFYTFANGTWLAETEIPAEEASWGGFGASGGLPKAPESSLVMVGLLVVPVRL